MTISLVSQQVDQLQIEFLQNSTAQSSATVIFIHAFPLNKEMWQTQLNQLQPNITGIAYDVRGFGGSSSGHRFFSIDLFARDLIAFIEARFFTNHVLCGISMGGYIALRALEIQPSMFSGIILVDTSAVADTNQTKLARFEIIEKLQKGAKETFVEEFLKKVLSPETFLNQPNVVSSLRKNILDVPVDTICATQLALATRTDTTHILDHIHIPSLIIRGEEDMLMPKEHAELLHSGIRGSEFIQIPGSGHFPNLENPEAFNMAINHFMRRYVSINSQS